MWPSYDQRKGKTKWQIGDIERGEKMEEVKSGSTVKAPHGGGKPSTKVEERVLQSKAQWQRWGPAGHNDISLE